MREDAEKEGPVKLHRDDRRRGDAVIDKNLLYSFEMVCADRLPRTRLRIAPQRTENRLSGLRKELAVFPQAGELGPDECEQLLFESLVVALLDLPLRAG